MEQNTLRDEVTDKYSLRGRVFNRLREDILTGKYKKGESIIESRVSKDLGVSRTPVREALRQLELEELVSIIPNKGAVVTGINADDIRDIYMIRSLIEGLAARKAATLMTESQIESLEEIIMLSEFHLAKRHMEKLYELDNKFHELLYEGSGSRMLRHVLSDYHHYAQRVRREALSDKTRAKASIAEHKAIVDAIKQRQPDKAERITNEHIRFTTDNVLKHKIAEAIEQYDIEEI